MIRPNVLLTLSMLAGISLWRALPSEVQANYYHQSQEETILGRYQADWFQGVVAEQTNDVAAWVDLGETYLGLGEFQWAIVALSHALQLDPNNLWAHSLRAQAYEQSGRPQLAIADLEAALALAPDDIELGQRLAALQPLSRKGIPSPGGVEPSADAPQRGSDHLDRLSQRIAMDPTNPELYYRRAAHFWSVSQRDSRSPQPTVASALARQSALRDLNIVIALDPSYSEAYLLRSRIYQHMAQIDQAIADLDVVEGLGYQDPDLFKQRALLRLSQGSEEAARLALVDAEQALRLSQGAALGEAYLVRGKVYSSHGELAQAIADFSQAIELQPYRPEAFFERGIATLQMGDDEATAASDLNSALMLWHKTGTGSADQIALAEQNRDWILTQLGR